MLARYQEYLNDRHEVLFGFQSSVGMYNESKDDSHRVTRSPAKRVGARPRHRFFSSYRETMRRPAETAGGPTKNRRGHQMKGVGGLLAHTRKQIVIEHFEEEGHEQTSHSASGDQIDSEVETSDSSHSIEKEALHPVIEFPNRFFPASVMPSSSAPQSAEENSAGGAVPHQPMNPPTVKTSYRYVRRTKKSASPVSRVESPVLRRPIPPERRRTVRRGAVPVAEGNPCPSSSPAASSPQAPLRHGERKKKEVCRDTAERIQRLYSPQPSRSKGPKTRRALSANVMEWANALGINLQFLYDKARLYRHFAGNPAAYLVPWTRVCRASQVALEQLLECSGPTLHTTPSPPERGDSRGRRSTKMSDNRTLRHHREFQEWSRSQLMVFFDHPSYLKNVWKGLGVNHVEKLLAGRYIIPSSERLLGDVTEHKKFRRRGMALRRLLLRELGLDQIGSDEEETEKKSSGSDEEKQPEKKPSSEEAEATLLNGRRSPLSRDMVMSVRFDTSSNLMDLHFYMIEIDGGLESNETFLGKWRAGCLDNWRWLILSGPLKDKVMFFDTRVPGIHAKHIRSGAGEEVLRHNGRAAAVVSAVSVTISSMIFQRVRRAETTRQHFVCSNCGNFFVQTRADRFEKTSARERCWICMRRTDLIPVSSSFEADKNEFLRTIRDTPKETRKHRVIPHSLIRQRVKEMVDQGRYELQHRPLWRFGPTPEPG